MPRRTARHRIRGVDYCINEWGDENAAQLFLLHGWGDTGSTFQFLVDELSADWMVIAPDWRGFGESHHRAECYWFPDYVADLDALLAIYSPDRAVRLVGHSMGANVAGLYAGVRPAQGEALWTAFRELLSGQSTEAYGPRWHKICHALFTRHGMSAFQPSGKLLQLTADEPRIAGLFHEFGRMSRAKFAIPCVLESFNFGEAAEKARVATRVELEGISQLGERRIGIVVARPDEFARLGRHSGDRVIVELRLIS